MSAAARAQRALVVRDEDVQTFAAATGDVNPLHVSDAFARRTPYGRPIAHGALVALVALTVVDVPADTPGRLTVQFRRPVFPGRRYVIGPVTERPDGWSLEVTDGGVKAVTVRLGPPSRTALRTAAGGAVEPAEGGPSMWDDEYSLRSPAALRALLHQFAGDVPERFVLPLTWASWFTGMVVPGEQALLSQIVTSGIGDADCVLRWRARLTRDDPRFGSVAISATASTGASAGEVVVESFRRGAAPEPSRTATATALAPGTALRGQHMLVVGGSRGIGAALTAAFTSQGATTHVAYGQSASQVASLAAQFGSDRVRPLPMDATDPSAVAGAVRMLADDGVALDGVVLCAAPALQAMPLHADTAEDALQHVEQAMRMAWLPLVHGLPLLRTTGWVVLLSSAAVQDPPPQWAHYVAAKAGLEAMVRSLAQDAGVAVLVARPPRVWTDLTNGPGAGQEAIRPDQVAATVVRWVLQGPAVAPRPHVLEPAAFLRPDR